VLRCADAIVSVLRAESLLAGDPDHVRRAVWRILADEIYPRSDTPITPPDFTNRASLDHLRDAW
jgi:hypothetical protein